MPVSIPTLIYITDEFPLGMHDFAYDELPFLQKKDWRIIIMPTNRPLIAANPVSVDATVDASLLSRDRCARFVDRFSFSAWTLLTRELVGKDKACDPVLYRNLSGATAHAAHAYSVLRRVLQEQVPPRSPVVIYSYWFLDMISGIALLRKEFPQIKIVTRAHGGDLYPERKPGGYMPFRRQRLQAVDAVFPCSKNGADLLRREGLSPEKIRVSYLGVPGIEGCSPPSSEGCLSLVSNCRITPVKRMPLLVDSLCALADARPLLRIEWNHLGGGDFFAEFAQYVKQKAASRPNMRYTLHGTQTVETCRSFMDEHPVDGFINVSESEGIPVSMMEALAVGVPIIGTNVGGVSEIVTPETGILLDKEFGPIDFIKAADRLFEWKNAEKRGAIKDFFTATFEQDSNYVRFVNELLWPQIAASADFLRQTAGICDVGRT